MSDALVVKIVEALEDVGVSIHSYDLHDVVDPEALGQFIESVDEDFLITLSVADASVEITQEGVTATPKVVEKSQEHTDTPSHSERGKPESVGQSLETTTKVDVYRKGIEVLDDFLDADRIKIAEVIDNDLVPIVSTNGGNVGDEYAVPKFGSIPGAVVESGDPCTIDDLHDVRGQRRQCPLALSRK